MIHNVIMINQQQQTNSYKLKIAKKNMPTISSNLEIPKQIAQYLQSQNCDNESVQSVEQVFKHLYSLLLEKDSTIQSLQSQITRYKAQSIKNNKMITQLQQKISLISPNANNTGSNFMMGSEFKEYFEEFFNNTLVNVMGPLAAYPEAYCKVVKQIFQQAYNSMAEDLQLKIKNICKILNLQQSNTNMASIRLSLLKILQDNHKNIFSQYSPSALTSHPFFTTLSEYTNPQLVQISESSELPEFSQKLINICSYMLLQQKSWHFVIPADSEKKIEKYNKKQFHCIDGWIKQKDEVIVVLEGLAKGDDWRHPNLRNYVIPFLQSEQQFVFLKKEKNVGQGQQKEGKQMIKFPQLSRELILQNSPKNQQKPKLQKMDNFSQYSPRESISPNLKKPKKQRRVLQQKQNQLPSNIQSSHSNIKNENSLSFTLNRDLSCGNVNKNKNKSLKENKIALQQQNKNALKSHHKNQGVCDGVKNKENFDSNSINSNFNLEAAVRRVFGSVTANVGTQRTSLLVQDSGDAQFGFVMSPHYTGHQKQKKLVQNQQLDSISANPSVLIKKSSKLKNSSKVSHNLISDPSFEQIVALPYKKKDIIDQLPLKRQNSRTKKSNSRKTSVGKIVGQAIEHKQNQMIKNNRQQLIRQNTKQSLYKDMIKQKLGTDHRAEHKADHKNENKGESTAKCEQKLEKAEKQEKGELNHKTERRESKNKYKEEDRPLRIMHFKKIREKYLNL